MTITEPMTMLTDYVLAVETLIFAILLFRISHRQISVRLWGASFSATTVAAIFGGTYHGFKLYLGEATEDILWNITECSIIFASFFMLSGTVISSVPRQLQKYFLVGISLKSLFHCFFAFQNDDFGYIIADYLSAMFVVLILQARIAYSHNNWSAKFILLGILVSLVGAGVQQSGLRLSENFNHNDLYHVISMLAFYLFYRGARLLKDW